MRKIICASLAFAALVPGTAFAEDKLLDGSWYVGAKAGVNFLLDSETNGIAGVDDSSFDPDFSGAGVIGYHFQPRSWGAIQLEFEGFYRRSQLDEARSGGTTGPSVEGDFDSYGAMFNMIYSADQLNWPVTPYIGGGIGYAEIDAELDFGNGIVIDDDDEVVAYQGIVGVRYPFTKKWSMTLEGRYIGTDNPQFLGIGQEIELEYEAIQANVGIQYRF